MEYKLVVVGAGGVGEYDSIKLFLLLFLNRKRTIFICDSDSVCALNVHFCNIIVALLIRAKLFHLNCKAVVQCTFMQV